MGKREGVAECPYLLSEPPSSFPTSISPKQTLFPPRISRGSRWGVETNARQRPTVETYLYNIFLKDPIKTQLTHGVDGLPLLGFLSGY